MDENQTGILGAEAEGQRESKATCASLEMSEAWRAWGDRSCAVEFFPLSP